MENNATINEIMRLIGSLNLNGKMEILFRLTKALRSNVQQEETKKAELVDELYGSWHDIEPSIIDEIVESRTSSDKEINFDL